MYFFPLENGDDQQTCSAATGDNFDCSDGNSALTRSSLSVDTGDGRKERACDSLIMCIVTTLNQGLRNGGGIGDILRAPSSQVLNLFIINRDLNYFELLYKKFYKKQICFIVQILKVHLT